MASTARTSPTPGRHRRLRRDWAVPRHTREAVLLGMNARLGFAIAAHMDPDVLFIDEVLSVGDMSYQQRCVERMIGFKRDGVAIVFVSHNLQACRACARRRCSSGRRRSPRARRSTSCGSTRASAPGPRRPARSLRWRAIGSPHRGLGDHVTPGARLQLTATVEAARRCATSPSPGRAPLDRHARVLRRELHARGTRPDPARRGPAYTLEFDLVAHLVRGLYQVAFTCSTIESALPAAGGPAGTCAVDEYRTWSGVADLEARIRIAPAHPGAASTSAAP